ncbi:hypothetical protein [Streptomyces sp. DH8]|uniref:hypothetical protein n=1 Tax=Streptomyces sp. DH8 TaxID=2857008 RepID=UPI001E318ABE|nr:hypothetical protein [Streptomyces sp. DH8]
MTDTPMTPDVVAIQQAATRAIHALKSPAPDGSRHYQSGWGDGLEAAIDAARDGVEGAARILLAEVDRLRKALSDATGQVAELEDDLGKAAAEAAALRQRLHEAAMARVWTNEDGKKFVFADDLKKPLLGKTAPVDEAAELAEGAAELEAMRRVPDSPDCTWPLTPEQALRLERDRPETRTTHDCTLPLVRRLDCGHCPHEVCQDCDRCPHTCECAPPEVAA